MRTDRRRFLAMLAILPFATPLEQWAMEKSAKTATSDPSKNFYVWLHGISGITFKKDEGGIDVVSPSLTASRNRHLYKIGRVTSYDAQKNSFEGAIDITRNAKYYFDGLDKATGKPQRIPDKRDTLVVQGQLTDDQPDMLYFHLPYPQAIWPLRFIKGTVNDTSAGENPGGSLPKGEVIPLTHVLEYDSVAASTVRAWWKDDSGRHDLWGPGTYNHLHIYAEPDPQCYGHGCHNARATIEALLGCYQQVPSFGIAQGESCPALDNTKLFCPDLNEQLGLFEWAGLCQAQSPGKPPTPNTEPLPTISGHECPHILVMEDAVAFAAYKKSVANA